MQICTREIRFLSLFNIHWHIPDMSQPRQDYDQKQYVVVVVVVSIIRLLVNEGLLCSVRLTVTLTTIR